jgi:hypothetical protein
VHSHGARAFALLLLRRILAARDAAELRELARDLAGGVLLRNPFGVLLRGDIARHSHGERAGRPGRSLLERSANAMIHRGSARAGVLK